MPKRMALLVVMGLAVVNTPMPGQAPHTDAPAPSFVVISIKPTAPDARGGRSYLGIPASQFVARNQTLNGLIAAAYNLTLQQVSGGPTWVDSDPYDILADPLGALTPTRDEQMSMLQTILGNRFKLTFHHEQKELPHYTLTVANNGSKLKESTMSPNASSVQGAGWNVLQGGLTGHPPQIFFIGMIVYPESLLLRGSNATMADLASVFGRSALDRPVVDKTGLLGRYNFDLRFTPDESQFGGKFREMTIDNLAKPALFTAIQEQLGLKLEPTKGPVDTIVIDHIDHPSSN
jgi:uncharacterized protein (TIGR03435 family)